MAISSSATGLRPGVCTSTTRPTAPYTGQIIYETDTGYLRVWDGAAWDYLSQSQDGTTNIKASDIGGTWLSWTPTWTNLTVGNATQAFRYQQIGKTVFVSGRLTFGSTTSVGAGVIQVNLPVTAQNINWTGQVFFEDTGINMYPGRIEPTTTTNLFLEVFRVDGTYATNPGVSSTTPFTWASGDRIWLTFTYEAA